MRTRSVKHQLARVSLVGALAIALTPALGATWASACSCAMQSDAEQAGRAQAVFAGTLVGTDKPKRITSSIDPVTYTFAVSKVFKGDVATEQPIRSVVDGASCGLELDGTGPFLVFAEADPKNPSTLRANLCGGTRPLGTGADPVLGAGSEPVAVPIVAVAESGDDPHAALLALGGLLGLVAAVGLVLELRRRRARSLPASE